MKNNANLFLAVAIIIGFIFFWDGFIASRYGKSKGKSPSANTNSVEPQKSGSSLGVEPRASTPPSTTMSRATNNSPIQIELQTNEAQVVLENQGARVKSWRILEKDHWLDVAPQAQQAKQLPLETFPDLIFELGSKLPERAEFTALHPSGYRIRKTLELSGPGELHRVRLIFENPTHSTLVVQDRIGWGSGLWKTLINNKAPAPTADAVRAEMRAIALNEKLRTWKPGVIFGRTVNETRNGPFTWFGVANNHFIAVLMPLEGTLDQLSVFADKKTAPSISIPIDFQLAPGSVKEIGFDLYVGPKKMSDLKALGHRLDEAVDFGMFGAISKALLRALDFFHKATGNYGWAIIILTICIQIVVFPLTKKSLEHSVKVKELQPQLKKIQEQFKSDPKRSQIETLNLYKKHGMHLMGLEGCFPVLLQIPIFFAFYATLNGAYELRGAPWIFWVKDLAGPDPFFVLPLLMGAGMFLQQKLTTVPTDPAQAKMMMFMPIIFTFMFLKMPSGLVLYWTVNSICTILSQRLLLIGKQSTAPTGS